MGNRLLHYSANKQKVRANVSRPHHDTSSGGPMFLNILGGSSLTVVLMTQSSGPSPGYTLWLRLQRERQLHQPSLLLVLGWTGSKVVLPYSFRYCSTYLSTLPVLSKASAYQSTIEQISWVV